MRVEGSAPTQAQVGLWLGHQRASDPSVYNAAEAIVFEPGLDEARFTSALAATQAEASSLRVAWVERKGAPRLVPVEAPPSDLRWVDLEDGARGLDAHAQAILRRPFEIGAGPLNRHALLRLGARRAWVHVAHHVALDGYGFHLFARRVAERYRSGASAPPCRWTALAPVVAEDHAYEASDARRDDLAFWRRELRRAPPADFGWGRAGPARGRRLRVSLGSGRDAALRAVAGRHGMDRAALLLATVAEALGGFYDLEDYLLGLPVMLRLGFASARTPCTAMNIVPLPVRRSEAASTVELAAQLRATIAAQRPHHRLRYEQLTADGGGRRPFGPVVNVMPFATAPRFEGVQAELQMISAGPVEGLSVGVVPGADDVTLVLDAHPEAPEQGALEGIAARIGAAVDQLEARRAPRPPRLFSSSPGVGVNVVAVLGHVSEHPDAPALVDGARVWSYRALRAAVIGAAGALQARGVGPGSLVALHLARGAPAIVTLLAARWLGAAWTALDPSHPSARRRDILDLAKPDVLVTGPDADLAEGVASRLEIDADTVDAWSQSEGPVDPAPARPSDLAYLAFTSGSTGRPKGVAIDVGALDHFVGAAVARYGWRVGDRVLQFASLAFDASVEEIFVALAAGATLVVRPEGPVLGPSAFAAWCAARDLTVLDLPTAYWHELAAAVAEGQATLPRGLRQIVIGGEAARARLARDFVAAAPGVALLNTYGPTEATVVATTAVLGPETEEPTPIGRPLDGVEAIVVGADGQPIAAPGVVGELYLVGPTLARGYLTPQDDGGFTTIEGVRAYRTGDRVSRGVDGALRFHGRADAQVKIAGHRVEPAEIEALLTEHPQVVAAVVWHEPERGLRAAVQADADRVSEAELRTHLRARVPAAAVPGHLTLWPSLPLTATGKIDRARLRQQGGAGAPSVERVDAVEARVIDAWRVVLGREAVALDDDFFGLGGHSLLLVRLAARLAEGGGEEVSVAALFDHPTPRMQARLLRGAADAPAARFEPWAVRPARIEASGVEPSARRALLTGATGFFGIELLRAWLTRSDGEAVCLVRAASDDEARARLEAAARDAGVAWSDLGRRVEVVAGELGAHDPARLDGLEPCGHVLHAAAQVSLTRSYESLVPPNVLGTRAMLERAAAWGAQMHHVSTIAVLPATDPSAPEAFFAPHEGLRDGYQRSKWHAEQLCVEAAAAGLPVAVYRLGRITGPARAPRVNAADIVWRVAQAAHRAGAWPDLDVAEAWTPADAAADVLVDLARAGAASRPASAYHVAPAAVVPLARVRAALEQARGPIEILSVPEWTARVAAIGHAEDQGTLAFFARQGRGAPVAPRVRTGRMQEVLPERALPDVGDDLLRAYVRAAIDLPEPSSTSRGRGSMFNTKPDRTVAWATGRSEGAKGAPERD